MTHLPAGWLKATLLLCLAQLAQPSAGQQGDPTRPAPRALVSAQVVLQKIAMVDKMLNHSPVAARVLNSQNEAARRHFTHARELIEHAQALSAGGLLRGLSISSLSTIATEKAVALASIKTLNSLRLFSFTCFESFNRG